jgi:hypothetical protein
MAMTYFQPFVLVLLLSAHMLAEYVWPGYQVKLQLRNFFGELFMSSMGYTLVFGLACLLVFDLREGILFACLNGTRHFIILLSTYHLSLKLYKHDNKQLFFAWMGLVQLAHQICLIISLRHFGLIEYAF